MSQVYFVCVFVFVFCAGHLTVAFSRVPHCPQDRGVHNGHKTKYRPTPTAGTRAGRRSRTRTRALARSASLSWGQHFNSSEDRPRLLRTCGHRLLLPCGIAHLGRRVRATTRSRARDRVRDEGGACVGHRAPKIIRTSSATQLRYNREIAAGSFVTPRSPADESLA